MARLVLVSLLRQMPLLFQLPSSPRLRHRGCPLTPSSFSLSVDIKKASGGGGRPGEQAAGRASCDRAAEQASSARAAR